jgi:hypothetical protein
MTSARNLVTGLLAVIAVGLGVLAWVQHQELAQLRAAALSPTERSDWQKRVWAAEKQRSELATKVAAMSKPAAEKPADPADAPPPPPMGEPRGGFGGGFAGMMDNPEVQRLIAIQQKGALDARYAGLFKALSLTPQQLDQFKNLLVEKSTSMMDVLAAARSQGINPRSDREAFQKLVTDAQTEIDASIRTTIGDAAFSQYKQYESTLPQRGVVSQLEQRLSYTPTPLTSQQSEQLVQVLANTTKTSGGATSPRALISGAVNNVFGGPGQRATITDATINQAAGVLAGPQVDALRQIQQEQQSQAALAAALRAQAEQRRANPGTGGSAPPPPPAPRG